jgi:hypothetical protein
MAAFERRRRRIRAASEHQDGTPQPDGAEPAGVQPTGAEPTGAQPDEPAAERVSAPAAPVPAPPPAAPAVPTPGPPTSPARPVSPAPRPVSPALAAGGEEPHGERGLRGLVGSGSSQVTVGAALRARDAARPTEQHLAEAEARLVIVRRNWVPREDLPRR